MVYDASRDMVVNYFLPMGIPGEDERLKKKVMEQVHPRYLPVFNKVCFLSFRPRGFSWAELPKEVTVALPFLSFVLLLSFLKMDTPTQEKNMASLSCKNSFLSTVAGGEWDWPPGGEFSHYGGRGSPGGCAQHGGLPRPRPLGPVSCTQGKGSSNWNLGLMVWLVPAVEFAKGTWSQVQLILEITEAGAGGGGWWSCVLSDRHLALGASGSTEKDNLGTESYCHWSFCHCLIQISLFWKLLWKKKSVGGKVHLQVGHCKFSKASFVVLLQQFIKQMVSTEAGRTYMKQYRKQKNNPEMLERTKKIFPQFFKWRDSSWQF